MGMGSNWGGRNEAASGRAENPAVYIPQPEPVVIPDTYAKYQPTAPISLASLFPTMSNPYLSGIFNTGYNAPLMPSFNNMGNFYGANRFLNPSVTSGLLNTGMTTVPTQTTTSNP